MKSPALTVKVFGIHLLRSPFGFAEAREPWIRVLGVVVVALAYYYWPMGVAGNGAFMLATVHARAFVFVAFLALVVLGLAAAPLVLFGVVDLAGAAWTYVALRARAGDG